MCRERADRALCCALLALLLGAIGGCQPKPGDSCHKGNSVCLDHSTQLVCDDLTYVATDCHGPKGCYFEGKTVLCDISGNESGDVCALREEGRFKCEGDGLHALVCRKSRYRIEDCPGGCKTLEGIAECNQW